MIRAHPLVFHHMPQLFMMMYKRISFLIAQLEPELDESLCASFVDTEILFLKDTKKVFEDFLLTQPDFVIQTDADWVTPETFLRPEYLKFVTQPLPYIWVDPYIIDVLNEAKRIYQIRETLKTKTNIYFMLSLIIYKGNMPVISYDLQKHILEYILDYCDIPILRPKTPIEFMRDLDLYEAQPYLEELEDEFDEMPELTENWTKKTVNNKTSIVIG